MALSDGNGLVVDVAACGVVAGPGRVRVQEALFFFFLFLAG
jgi:hypothetical protein